MATDDQHKLNQIYWKDCFLLVVVNIYGPYHHRVKHMTWLSATASLDLLLLYIQFFSSSKPCLSSTRIITKGNMNTNNTNTPPALDDDEEEVTLPGFRFHPTDEELVGFYLRRKVDKKPLSIELIKQVDIYKYDPWDLPSMYPFFLFCFSIVSA